jgi:hypothetical protein
MSRFDGALDDIFELQDQVASNVVGVIEPKLRQSEIEQTAVNISTDTIPLQKLCITRSTMTGSSSAMSRLANAHIAKTKALHSATRRSDMGRAKIAAIGMPATSAIVATHAIHDACSNARSAEERSLGAASHEKC